MEEAIEILRLTSSRENVDYNGQYWRFRNLTVLPRPVQQPIPIWVTSNPDLNKRRNAEEGYRRVARLGDGWMTTFKSPEDVQTSLAMIREYAREMGHELKPDFEVAIYHNINVDEDRDRALAEAKRFLATTGCRSRRSAEHRRKHPRGSGALAASPSRRRETKENQALQRPPDEAGNWPRIPSSSWMG